MARKVQSATTKGKIEYTPCRVKKGYEGAGQFYDSEFCGKSPKKITGKKKSGGKKTGGKKRGGKKRGGKKTTTRTVKGYTRDSGGNCRKKGKRGFAKESMCKRYGV